MYKVITKLAIINNEGVHPKHGILRYRDFFVSNIESGERVLDVGCARGEVASAVAKAAREVIGIDINTKKIEQAKSVNQRENVKYLSGDVIGYDFVGKFDKIILSNVLEHIDGRVEFLKHLLNLGHTILLRVPMLDRDWLAMYKKSLGSEYRLDPTHYIEYTAKSLGDELKLSGWYLERYSIQFGELWGVLKKTNS